MVKEMGQGIINKKIFSIYMICVSFIMIMCNACEQSYSPIRYNIIDITGKRSITVNTIKKDISSYEKLINTGSVLHIEFAQLGNREYLQALISLNTLEKHRALKIHKIEFEFDDRKEIVEVNKRIRLKQEYDLFTVEDNNELTINVFFDYIFYNRNSIRLYLQDVFNKTEDDVGKTFEMTSRVNYSLDRGDIETQEIKYLVSIIKNSPHQPDWVYMLFTGEFLRR